ncbi:MAG: calcineurin-like phosphoesterase family protein [Thermaurantiacus sp.]|uniref:calcineurin-like phosphoesterase family protein n=1 Tax=Thermaurantiacus sp. TaxID=2820283 RepID=UPI00298F3D65|nr:calcineurin-like phosphoesterase family protein [Thermaurantiacus sp.]MDW8414146.1 calcineurin-like phosphoesterase family protein [Thermaurantiacus sp.]
MRARLLALALWAGAAGANPAAPWIAAPEVVRAAPGDPVSEVAGLVFEDRDLDGRHQPGERGLRGVLVSNGLEVVATDRAGRWRLPYRPDMNLMVIQPAGFEVPVDARRVPQFAVVHKAGGSPRAFRFGGVGPSAPPRIVNFPLRRLPKRERFSCAVLADVQAYSGAEVGYFRDGVLSDLLRDPPGTHACLLWLGDNVGDDLGLLPRLLEAGAAAAAPQWLVVGNHDIDFDATDPADSADSFRRLWGPDHWAFMMGRVLFVGLNNVVYPCGPADAGPGDRAACASGQPPTYNGRIPERQLTWLGNLLRLVPRDRLVVVLHHIPFVSFADPRSGRHQTDNAAALHALLAGRPALSVAGHTHTTENHAPGTHVAGWREAVGVGPLPFRHLIAGAASGGWYQGDLDSFGIPQALTRFGAPRGHLRLEFEGARYRERYVASRLEPGRVAWLSLNTTGFRRWFEAIAAWLAEPEGRRDPVPPRSAQDLPDPRLLTPADLAEGAYLVANVWLGDEATRVTARLDDGPELALERTQEGRGEEVRAGAEWADPFAATRQLSVARVAMQSRSGEPRNQGVEVFRGQRVGPAPPRPMGPLAESSPHLWRLRLPPDLPQGLHVATVVVTDRHGRSVTERFPFEVRPERPPMRFRRALFPQP